MTQAMNRIATATITWLLVWIATSQAVGAKPNVVLILIDDLSHYGVTAYGANRLSEERGAFEGVEFSTPRIDRLAADGLRCDNAHAYPLCEPSRIALMTGQYNSRNFLAPKALHASQVTFSDVFKKAGYATGVFGKWKQTRGTREVAAADYLYEFGWDEFCCFDVIDERQRYINPYLVVNGEVQNYANRTDLDPHTGRRWYGPDICNRHALDFIDRHRDEPFFLYYPMILVHDEHKPTPDTEPREVFDNFPEKACYKPGCGGDDRRYFPDMLAYMDKLIGRVVDKLEQHNLRDDTLIVVMGDNGTKEPFTHLLPDGSSYPGGKGGNKDNGTHVPLIVSWPSKIPDSPKQATTANQAGDSNACRTYEGLIDIVDIYPTLAEAAGVTLPPSEAVDGISFWPQVIGAPGEPRQAIYTWYNANGTINDLSKVLRYAFDKEFKRYAPHANYPEGRFFDLRSDPLELAGERRVRVDWGHYHRSGLDQSTLNAEQREAYRRLGALIDEHAYVPVTDLVVEAKAPEIVVGEKTQLHAQATPSDATRQGIIWESDDPAVATVDKFGVVTAHQPGSVTIAAYSWDDAYPVAANADSTFSKAGVRGALTLTVSGYKSP